MQGRGFRVARIGGVDVRVDPSFLVIALLITSNLWTVYASRTRFPTVGAAGAIGLALLAAFLFFLSILGHELAHAAVSRARGIPVEGIVLYMFGGATFARLEDRGPEDEFLTTVVGPISSAAIGGLFLLVHSAATGLPPPLDVTFSYLGRLNILLAVFNILPGYPLDGGRILHAIVWRLTRSAARATTIAARTGQAFGGVLVALSIYRTIADQYLGWLWLGLVGWMLLQAATGALADGRRRSLLERSTVREVMSPPPPSISADMPLSEAVSSYLSGHEDEAFPVMDGGAVVGLISLRMAAVAPPGVKVRDAMADPGLVVVASPDDSMDSVTARLSDTRGSVVLVLQDGRLAGVIEPADVSRFFKRARTG